MITSEEAGIEKLNRRMFDMIATKLGVKNDEVIYVGDSYKKDVMGAKNAGMTPVWYLSLQNKTDEDVLAACNYAELRNIVNKVI